MHELGGYGSQLKGTSARDELRAGNWVNYLDATRLDEQVSINRHTTRAKPVNITYARREPRKLFTR